MIAKQRNDIELRTFAVSFFTVGYAMTALHLIPEPVCPSNWNSYNAANDFCSTVLSFTSMFYLFFSIGLMLVLVSVWIYILMLVFSYKNLQLIEKYSPVQEAKKLKIINIINIFILALSGLVIVLSFGINSIS